MKRIAQSRKLGLAVRSATLRAVREFFHGRGFLEVETPIRLPAPALETHIDAEPAGAWYLRTSPELHMKRLLAEGFDRIFQVGPCFRRGERGARHHPEYTMLEWYRAGTDYEGILDDTRELLRHVTTAVLGEEAMACRGRRVDVGATWDIRTVSEAFRRWAGWDPADSWDPDRFDLDLVDKVEPALPRDVPVVLKDYPAPAAALSRRKLSDPRLAERWELYIAGVELANAYTELTDPAEQRDRFEECARARAAAGRAVYPLDEDFLAALPDMPPCGGIALGVDRLAMLLADAPDLDAVIAFREG